MGGAAGDGVAGGSAVGADSPADGGPVSEGWRLFEEIVCLNIEFA